MICLRARARVMMVLPWPHDAQPPPAVARPEEPTVTARGVTPLPRSQPRGGRLFRGEAPGQRQGVIVPPRRPAVNRLARKPAHRFDAFGLEQVPALVLR